MSQITFEEERPASQVDPGRSDAACFVGLVRRAGFTIPPDVRNWFQSHRLLRFPFKPAAGATLSLPPNVRAWFIAQGWIQGLVAGAAAPDATLAAAVNVSDSDIATIPAFSGDPETVAVDREVMGIQAVDKNSGNLTVTRGAARSNKTAHAVGAPVFFRVIGSLATDTAADAVQITLTRALTADAPLFARVGAEIVSIAEVGPSGTTLTIGRGAAGTSAVQHNEADPIVAVALDPLAELAVQVSNSVPATVQTWLQTQGWLTGPFARDLDQLCDVPVPMESYAAFTQMFDPGGSAASAGTDYVATAVRSFFAQGGKRCYLVSMGDPIGLTDTAADKNAKLQSILLDGSHQGGDPSSWHGIGHLAGLPDVSFLAVPDLPVLIASAPPGAVEFEPQIPLGPVQFAECSQENLTVQQFRLYPSPAPRLSAADFGRWASRVADILQYIASGSERQELHLREIQFVAAFPLPQNPGVSPLPGSDASDALAQDLHDVIALYLPEIVEPPGDIAAPNISSAFLQLAYPWLKTTASTVLSESLEPPDGALVGVLARNALKNGTFNSATKVVPSDISDVWPTVPRRDTRISSGAPAWASGTQPKPLVERVSLFAFTPSGVRLLSDVSAYPGEAYRAAAVNRLVSVICRAARNLGQTIVFDQTDRHCGGAYRRSFKI